jgi:hypothetical protein
MSVVGRMHDRLVYGRRMHLLAEKLSTCLPARALHPQPRRDGVGNS